MKIENYGTVWHIDQSLLVSSFDLFNEDNIKKCLNYVNLRPMQLREKISKGAKIDLWLYLIQEIKAKFLLQIW